MLVRAVVFVLLICWATMVTCKKEFRPPPLPVVTSVQVSTTQDSDGARITVEYMAPEEPFVLWFVNGLPIRPGRVDYHAINDFGRTGTTIMSSLQDKSSDFGVCLQNVVGEVCLYLNPLPHNAVVREDLHFPWPLMTPGPLVRYTVTPDERQTLKVHAPQLDTPHNYTYSVILISKNPHNLHGRLVETESRDMVGGRPGDEVTIGPVSSGSGWMIVVRTDLADYEGSMMVNTTFVPLSGLIKSCSLYRPFTIYRRDHLAPFPPGFVAPVHVPDSWRCRRHVDCMIVCPFVANGRVAVTISKMTSPGSILSDEELPVLMEEEQAVTRMLGPYVGFAYLFLPDFVARRDAGTYQCKYTTDVSGVVGTVEVD